MLTPGQRLRAVREQLGLTIRDVEMASARIAKKHNCEEYTLPLSRLSDIETKHILPNIYRLYSLSVIYRRDFRELLAWYGVDLDNTAFDLGLVDPPPRSHRSDALPQTMTIQVPLRLDPGFDGRKTTSLGRAIRELGALTVPHLAEFVQADYVYGYIGTEDYTMYPIVPPGSFVQIDESRVTIREGPWRSEYERPIYFIETRQGFTCSWCALRENELILQPHPLSLAPVRILRHPMDADVVGQVVGVAMKLASWKTIKLPSLPQADN